MAGSNKIMIVVSYTRVYQRGYQEASSFSKGIFKFSLKNFPLNWIEVGHNA